MSKKESDGESNGFVKWFSELSNNDVSIAGGKGASLAEMYNHGFPVPPGFIITAQAYSYFIEKSGLNEKMKLVLDNLDVEDTKDLEEKAKKVREIIENAEMPEELKNAVIEAYDILDIDKKHIDNAKKGALDILKNSHEPPFVAVRSSATTEDLADASFAGQQESFLNVKGRADLIENVKKCFASLFTARAVYYRAKKGFYHLESKLAIVVQRMVDSEKSGVIFSKSPVSNKDEIIIEAVWGLGEGIVSGMIKPDHYLVSSDLEKILEIKLAEKKVAIVRNSSGKNVEVKLSGERAKQQVLNNHEIRELSRYAKKLEQHYKKPQDIEFAIEKGEIYIVQSRPITVFFKERKEIELGGEVLVSGLGASPGVASGPVKIIRNLNELSKIQKGDVLVTLMTNPDMVVSMQKAAAIVTDEGGVTSHAAIVSREMGIPAVVGTENATSILHDGLEVTVDGSSGKVFLGKGETKLAEINPAVQTRTKIKVILDLPDFAERAAKTGLKSVGLSRLEGIIASSGKHPLYFVKEKRIDDYVKVLSNGLKKIAEHFEEVWVRTSDLRSDEFGDLEGSPKEKEENPMLGNHGIRFSLKHKEILEGELEAVKKTAMEFPDKKIGIMIPQVINLEELQETKKIASKIQMPANVKIGIMVETPAAVQIINSLCEEGMDFISFGTNDLTQYMLAIDRNNPEIQDLFNEMNPAVLSALSYVIRRCKKYGVETSICGQAGSRPEMAKFLVKEGIDSISVNADAAEKVSKLVSEIESGLLAGNANDKYVNLEEKKHEKREEKREDGKKIEILAGNAEKDIEEIIMTELDGSKNGGEEKEDYLPGSAEKENNIPDLNDAIPIDSEMFNQK